MARTLPSVIQQLAFRNSGSYFRNLLLVLSFLAFFSQSKAQNYSYDAGGSDYQGTFSFGDMAKYPEDKGSTNWKWGKTTGQTVKGGVKSNSLSFSDAVSNDQDNASKLVILGPGYSQTWTLSVHKDGDGCTSPAVYGSCVTESKNFDNSSGDISVTTAALKKPLNLTSVINRDVTYIDLAWQKGSNVPDSYIEYGIYRDGTLIGTAVGTARTYRDNSPVTNTTHTYTVKTQLNATGRSSWGDQKSDPSNAVNNFVYSNTFTASDGEYNKVILTWSDLSKFATDIKVFRDGEELAVLNKTSKSYSDFDGVPGKTYKYSILPINGSEVFVEKADSGYKKAIGKISGNVRSKQNSGVSGVTVTANGTVEGILRTYTTTTDAAGYYELREIYFGANEASFTVTPSYSDHKFNPDKLVRKLDINSATASAVDFTDTTALSISGKVYYPNNAEVPVILPVEGAEIFVNGKSSGIKTKADGSYSVTIYDAGTYLVKTRFKNHPIIFKGGGTADSVKSIVMNSAVNGIDFEDRKTDTLNIKIQAGCNAPIGDNILVSLRGKRTGWNPSTSAAANLNKSYTIYADGQTNNPPSGATNGIKTLVLPATDFEVEITGIFTNIGPDDNKLEYFKKNYGPLQVNLAQRDTTTLSTSKTETIHTPPKTVTLPSGRIDTIAPGKDTTITKVTTSKALLPHELAFIYHKDLKLDVNDADVFQLKDFGPKKKYLAAQNDNPILNIRLFEHYEYKGIQYDCPLDSGTVYVYDAVSDRGERQAIKIGVGGLVKYQLKIGKPVLESPYEKKLQLVAVVGDKSVSKEIIVVVEGERPRNSTFLTKTPQIPFFILHDPPGDLSSAKISKGTTFATSVSTQYQVGGGAGAYVDAKVGAGTDVPFIGKIGADVYVGAKLEAGRDNTSSSTTNFTFTFNEDFSTSGEETLVGEDGDLYVGASLNMEYALTDVLKYNPAKKDMDRDTSFAADYTGFNSTYLYTEYHIKHTLIPQLQTILGLSKSKFNDAQLQKKNGSTSITDATLVQLNKEMLENQANLEAWNKALDDNDKARKNPTVRTLPDQIKGVVGGNISFSAGALYDNTLTIDTLTETSTEFSVYVNTEAKIGLGIHAGDFNSLEAGALMTVRMLDTKGSGSSTQNTKTVSYHMEDNDLGDFFSVGLFEDRRYGTPIFKTVTGSSSCPHEDYTQYRHLPAVTINGTNEQRNVPADQSAKFSITIANRSESDETVEYAVKLDPLSNPNGARVLVAGQDAVNGQATFTIPTGKSYNLPVEVFRGPSSSVYENLSLVMFSTCDNTLDDVIEGSGGVETHPRVSINAYFQNKCSEVDLFRPGNNWLVNQSNNDELYVAFSKYDASAGSPLTTVSLEYRKLNTLFLNSQWQTVVTVPKSQLNEKYYNYTFNVKGLDDGEYELRAVAVCAGVDVNYSPVYRGKIDRVSAVAFGLPSPKDGILRIGDYIGVVFNKDLSCDDKVNPVLAKLTRKDNGKEIPATLICNGKNIEIRTVPETLINDYENVELVASLQNLRDNTGNLITDTINWSFVVNRSPVYWDPANVAINSIENVGGSFSAKIKNKTALNQSFSLVKYPQWLKPTVKSGKVLPFGEVNIDFSIDRSLNTAIYTDTVVAMVNNKPQNLYVEVSVLRTPPDWKVNPANFRYSMNITSQFSRNETDTLISKDSRDKIAVFVGEQCRGVAQVEFDETQQKYVAYVTAYSNNPNVEQLTFRLWDAYPGVEYQSKERLDFISGGIVGDVTNPYIAHAEGVIQSIILKKGWNWVSLNSKNPDMSVKNVLKSLKSTPGDVIKTLRNNAYSQYSQKMGWVGNLDSISLISSYMISVAHDDTLRVLGQPQQQQVLVQLNKGWNWMGYPMSMNIDVKSYFKNFKPADKDVVMSQEEFSQYNASTQSWSGSLKYLRPGKGYRFLSNNGITVPAFAPADKESESDFIQALTNPVAGTPVEVNNPQTSVSSTTDPNVKVNTIDFKNNMSVTAVIVQDGNQVNDPSRYEIRVYIEGQVVSVAQLTKMTDGQAIAFIPVYGNDDQDGKNVEVKIFDKQQNKVFPITIASGQAGKHQIIAGVKSGNKIMGPGTPDHISSEIVQQQDKIDGTVEQPRIFYVDGRADVQVTASVSRDQINLGDTVAFTYKLKNNGPDVALNVRFADTLTTAFDYVSSDQTGLVFEPTNRSFSYTLASMNPAIEQAITVRLRSNKVGIFQLGRGMVSSNNDPSLANNSLIPVQISVLDKRADLASKLFIPGLFTPNGDGINDQFVIGGLNDYYKSNVLVIYNKSYNKVYYKVNYQNDWSGDHLPMGSYGYILRATGSDGVEHVFKGYITIAY
ncbi:DUF11 domain-containing protein [Pedobacter sp. HMF7647]|uniref:DUF11 domain-containing protein n=1 Tax=Hufsiella arboris TaxID=2695275 RepID=A0A7K1Y8U1_9SPHI|nr:gliding motility-associated C-terminal domain-containing protein [Hufsiella arboris]MXV51012.1 DUF11 domain-containing protein [Hufsiella arboris]